MVSTEKILKDFLKKLMTNPLYLVCFAVWLLTVLAELGFVETHPIDWLNSSIDKTHPAAGFISSLGDKVKNSIHKFLIIFGLLINLFFCRHSERIKLVNVFCIILVIVIRVDLKIFVRFIVVIVAEFLFVSIDKEEHKLYVIILGFCFFYFEDKFEEVFEHNDGTESTTVVPPVIKNH